MIANLNSKKEVLLDTFNNVSGKPKVELVNLIVDKDGFKVNGSYFYEVTNGDVIERHLIANISTRYSAAEIHGLCTALGAPDVNAILLATLQGALKHVVASDGKWGLASTDWE